MYVRSSRKHPTSQVCPSKSCCNIPCNPHPKNHSEKLTDITYSSPTTYTAHSRQKTLSTKNSEVSCKFSPPKNIKVQSYSKQLHVQHNSQNLICCFKLNFPLFNQMQTSQLSFTQILWQPATSLQQGGLISSQQ